MLFSIYSTVIKPSEEANSPSLVKVKSIHKYVDPHREYSHHKTCFMFIS